MYTCMDLYYSKEEFKEVSEKMSKTTMTKSEKVEKQTTYKIDYRTLWKMEKL